MILVSLVQQKNEGKMHSMWGDVKFPMQFIRKDLYMSPCRPFPFGGISGRILWAQKR